MFTLVAVIAAIAVSGVAFHYRRKYLIALAYYNDCINSWEAHLNARAALDAKVLASLRAVCDSHKAPIKHPVECLDEAEITQMADNFYNSKILH
jgi:hypothetical protein